MTEAMKRLKKIPERNVMHRDIKPENILFKKDKDGIPERFVLTDFGLAKEVDAERTISLNTCSVLGTLPYMDPHPRPDGADLWAMAVMAFQLLCRRLPFGSISDMNSYNKNRDNCEYEFT